MTNLSMATLTQILFTTTADVASLLPHLLQFTEEHREEGMALQDDLDKFQVELDTVVEEVWQKPVESGGDAGPKGLAARMEDKDRHVHSIERVEKPGLAGGDWHMKLLQMGHTSLPPVSF